MTKLKTMNRDGWHWLVAEVNDRIYWLHRQARIGHCFRPGQRAH